MAYIAAARAAGGLAISSITKWSAILSALIVNICARIVKTLSGLFVKLGTKPAKEKLHNLFKNAPMPQQAKALVPDSADKITNKTISAVFDPKHWKLQELWNFIKVAAVYEVGVDLVSIVYNYLTNDEIEALNNTEELSNGDKNLLPAATSAGLEPMKEITNKDSIPVKVPDHCGNTIDEILLNCKESKLYINDLQAIFKISKPECYKLVLAINHLVKNDAKAIKDLKVFDDIIS